MDKKERNELLASFDMICKSIAESKDGGTFMKNTAYRLLTLTRSRNRAGVYDILCRMALNTELKANRLVMDSLKELVDMEDQQFEEISYLLVGKVIKYS